MGHTTNRSDRLGARRLPALIAVSISASLALGAVVAACSESTIDVAGGPLSVTVTADPTTQSVGMDVAVRAEVRGTSLSGTILDFGDGQVDSFAAFGANTQTVTQMKAYDSAGTYTIVATAEDPSQGASSGQVTVQINP